MHTFRRIQREPFVEGKLIEQARFALQQQTASIALGRILDCQFVALPVSEAFHHLAIERVSNVVGRERGIARGLHRWLYRLAFCRSSPRKRRPSLSDDRVPRDWMPAVAGMSGERVSLYLSLHYEVRLRLHQAFPFLDVFTHEGFIGCGCGDDAVLV